MKKFKKILAVTAVSAMLATSLVGCSGDQNSTSAVDVVTSDAVVATISGVEISESLYRTYLWSAQQFFEQISGPAIWEIDLEGRKTEDIAKERALESATLSVVTQQKAEELGIKLTKEEKKEARKNAEQFAEVNPDILVAHQFDVDDVEELLLATDISNKVQEKLMENYVPAEEEATKFVEENKAVFETVTAKHVLIKTVDEMNQPLPEAEQAKKLELANEVLTKALAGEDMATLATDYTEDPGSLATGGEYTFGRGEMVPEFEAAAFDGKDGEVWPELVKTTFGYHIIKTEKHNAADEAKIKEFYVENEKITFVNKEFGSMIEGATVEKTPVFDEIKIVRAEPVVEEAVVEEPTTEDVAPADKKEN